MNDQIKATIRITATTHFPTHFAVKTTYFLEIQRRQYVITFWTYFLDGHDAAIILN